MPPRPVQVCREALYEQVWSESVIRVAKKYGITGTTLSKHERVLNPHGGSPGDGVVVGNGDLADRSFIGGLGLAPVGVAKPHFRSSPNPVQWLLRVTGLEAAAKEISCDGSVSYVSTLETRLTRLWRPAPNAMP